LLRTNLTDRDPKKLWRQYIQLTEIEAVFRTLKTELNLRPIFHRIQRRVEAHILIAFLGYCLWVCLKQKLRAAAGSLTPAQIVHSLKQVILVEVWFDLRKGGRILSAPHHPSRSSPTACLAPFGLVITGATATQNLPRPKPVCVDDLRRCQKLGASKSTSYITLLIETAKLRLAKKTSNNTRQDQRET
jgi:hypothetical protein